MATLIFRHCASTTETEALFSLWPNDQTLRKLSATPPKSATVAPILHDKVQVTVSDRSTTP
jgi:hypothetical protein